VQVDWLSTQVVLSFAANITGPWESVPIYKIPPPYNDPDLFICYAGKSHPELARGPEELVVTYMTNTWGDLQPLFEKGAKGLYTPKLLRVTLGR
jgi:hypothetical protein